MELRRLYKATYGAGRGRPYSYLPGEDQVKAVMSPGKRGHLTPDAFHELDELPYDLVQLLRRCWDFDLLQRPDRLIKETDKALDELEEQAAMLSLNDDISRFITSVSPQAICINGRFGDVFKGTHKTLGEVALKRLRIGGAVDEQVIRVRLLV
ncbi:hypothetical protein FS837_011340 [Tulasnella sp. UAMH 9824]|nr:hypothetical protein FS837_011340 [Tulasnella sp. UAMH 9824]